MDLQDVANLTIPEGGVKTIHDKDNRLLWGAVGYDTKYTGNTTQDGEPTPDAPVTVNVVTGAQSIWLHGKNLFDKSTVPGIVSSGMSTEQLSTGIRAINDVVVEHSSIRLAYYKICDLSNVMGETVTMSVNIASSSVNRPRAVLGFARGNYGNRTEKVRLDASGSGSFVVDGVQSDQTIMYLALYSVIGTTSGDAPSGSYVDYTDLQIEIGDQATSYESFVTPQTYTVGLGATELCKIGDYQDKIFNNDPNKSWYNPDLEDNAWYVHKAIKKVMYDGSEADWNRRAFNDTRTVFEIPASDIESYTEWNATPNLYSDRFIAIRYNATWAKGDMSRAVNAHSLIFTVGPGYDVASWKTWLSSNNVTAYYVLATATDTQITDATLIGQLNTIHEWLTRYGYNATVSGNLPIIIDRTNL